MSDLREAATEVLRAHDAYMEAAAGRGHEGPHDKLICPGSHDLSHSYEDDCSSCGGAQYGTDYELSEAYVALRIALEQPLKPHEQRSWTASYEPAVSE